MKGFRSDIEKDTLENENFRKVLYTSEHTQLVLMTLKPGEEIGLETHEENDQFFRFESGEGKVTIDPENQHISKTARIGKLRPDGLIDTVFESEGPIKPDPFLKTYPWAKGL